MPEQCNKAPAVPARAKQGAEAEGVDTKRPKAEATVWTDRMVSALVNGVKGGRWFSLIDKVWAPATLADESSQTLLDAGANHVASVLIESRNYLAGLLELPRLPVPDTVDAVGPSAPPPAYSVEATRSTHPPPANPRSSRRE